LEKDMDKNKQTTCDTHSTPKMKVKFVTQTPKPTQNIRAKSSLAGALLSTNAAKVPSNTAAMLRYIVMQRIKKSCQTFLE
jgi:hypothetical protein